MREIIAHRPADAAATLLMIGTCLSSVYCLEDRYWHSVFFARVRFGRVHGADEHTSLRSLEFYYYILRHRGKEDDILFINLRFDCFHGHGTIPLPVLHT